MDNSRINEKINELCFEVANHLDEKFWLENQLKEVNGQMSDLGAIFHEAMTAIFLSEKLEVAAEWNTEQYWKELCIEVIKNYVPACKTKKPPGRHASPVDKKRLLIGRIERIKANFPNINSDERACLELMGSGMDTREWSSLKSNCTNYRHDIEKIHREACKAAGSSMSDDEITAQINPSCRKLAEKKDGKNPAYLQG